MQAFSTGAGWPGVKAGASGATGTEGSCRLFRKASSEADEEGFSAKIAEEVRRTATTNIRAIPTRRPS